MTHMLRLLVDKADSMQELDDVSREIDTQRNIQKRNIRCKNSCNRNDDCLGWARS